MTRFLKVAIVVMLGFMLSTTVFASSNKYSDDYTTEDSSGNWTFSGSATIGGDLTVSGTSLLKAPTVTVTAATGATLTTTQSGTVFVVDDGATSTNTYCNTFTLPVAASGLTYKFISGDGSGIKIRSSDSNLTGTYSDTFLYGLNGIVQTFPSIKSTVFSPANYLGATGTSITVYGNVTNDRGVWYVEPSNAGTGGTIQMVLRATNPGRQQ